MSSIGALIGAPARASMVTALFDGRARTASELARVSGVSSSTASEHLEKLRAGRLVVCERFGRFRYYRLAGSDVAELLEPLVHLVGKRPVPFRRASRAAAELQNARMCYDHLAGRLGVMLTEAMLGRGQMVAEDRDFALTADGEVFCAAIGIPLEAVRSQRRTLARQCLDWSERRPHLAGSLGAAIAELALSSGWIERERKGRRVFITARGGKAFLTHFGIKN